jgi:hypothetical protein
LIISSSKAYQILSKEDPTLTKSVTNSVIKTLFVFVFEATFERVSVSKIHLA